MRQQPIVALIPLFTLAIGAVAIAQRQGADGPPMGPPRDFMRMMPVVAALDVNEDGEISSRELSRAVKALKTLDKNSDGKLTEEEIRPSLGPPPEGGFRGPAFGDPPELGGPAGMAQDPQALISRWLELDENGDHSLSEDELGRRMRGLLFRADADNDGVASENELRALAAAEANSGADGPGMGRPGSGGPNNRNDRGASRTARLPGGMSPEAFMARAFAFDTDANGQLSKEELSRMVAQLHRPQ